jgi:hypothetical protein
MLDEVDLVEKMILDRPNDFGLSYYRRNKSRLLSKIREYQKEHKEEVYLKNTTWQRANREIVNASSRKYASINKELLRLNKIDQRYGKGANQHYLDQYEAQDNKCAICLVELVQPHRDHNNDTKQWRGVLCGSCNRALGLFKESINSPQSAIGYLKKWEGLNVR